MFEIIILPIARQDIKEAAHWYNKQQKGLGNRFATHIRQKVYFLADEPYSIAIRYDNIRAAVVDIFSYMIHYYIDEPQNTIVVVAILHTSRNPDIWKNDVR